MLSKTLLITFLSATALAKRNKGASTLGVTAGNCPTTEVTWCNDDTKYFASDSTGQLWDLVTPDRIDNAGFYRNEGWDRLPDVSPTETYLLGRTYGVQTDPHLVEFMLSDQYGNTKNCTIHVNVKDCEDPTITCPTNKNVYTELGTCEASVSWTEPDTDDNDYKTLTVSDPDGGTNGQSYDRGETTISYDVFDHATPPNNDSCEFKITVTDNEKPQFTSALCVATQDQYEVSCDGLLGSHSDASVSYDCPATDNCDTVATECSPWVEIDTSHYAPEPLGDSNATALGSCDGDRTYASIMEDAESTSPAVGSWLAISTTGCGVGELYAELHDDFTSLSTNTRMFIYMPWTAGTDVLAFPVPPMNETIHGEVVESDKHATYTVSCKSTDLTQNVQTTTLSFAVYDNRKKPTFAYCPTSAELEEIQLHSPNHMTTIAANFTTPYTFDNQCTPNVVEVNGKSNETALTEGVHMFSYKATDAGGNEKFCDFQITVEDKNEMYWHNCPTPAVVETDSIIGTHGIVTWTEPEVWRRGGPIDDTSLYEVIAPDFKSGMAYPLGKFNVTYYFKDKRAHMNEFDVSIPCEFTIEVVDREKPMFDGPWNDGYMCAEGDSGVDEFDVCGGMIVEYVSEDFESGSKAITTQVTDLTDTADMFDCCGSKSCIKHPDSNTTFYCG